MSIGVDRPGIPQHDGKAEHFTEYEERSFNLIHGRIGRPEPKATALHPRSGLDHTYEAVGKLKHEDLLTSDEHGTATIDRGK